MWCTGTFHENMLHLVFQASQMVSIEDTFDGNHPAIGSFVWENAGFWSFDLGPCGQESWELTQSFPLRQRGSSFARVSLEGPLALNCKRSFWKCDEALLSHWDKTNAFAHSFATSLQRTQSFLLVFCRCIYVLNSTVAINSLIPGIGVLSGRTETVGKPIQTRPAK